MKKLWLLLLMVIPLQLVHSQAVQHAPTVEQCRADERSWISKLEQEPLPSGIANVSIQELQAWKNEMADCLKVDAAFQVQYLSTISEADAGQLTRLQHFLKRHDLLDQFLAEDAQGKR